MNTKDKINYDEIPVVYCKRCHSLEIIAGDNFPDYCNKCGSTDLGDCLINEWLIDEQSFKKGIRIF